METTYYSRSFVLDYPADDPWSAMELYCIFSIRIQDFIAKKRKDYAAEITEEQIEAQLAATYFAPGFFSEEQKRRYTRTSMIEDRYKTAYNFQPVERDDNPDSLWFIATCSGYGTRGLYLQVIKYIADDAFILCINARENDPEHLQEFSDWFCEPFRIIPREKLIGDFLSGRDASHKNLYILCLFKDDVPFVQEELLPVYQKALTIPDVDILDEVLVMLWYDIREGSPYISLLKKDLEALLANVALTTLMGPDQTDFVKEILESVN